MALATEKTRSPFAWTKDSTDQLVWTATRTFQVSGATSWDDAESILNGQFADTVDGETHPGGHGAVVIGVSRDRATAGGFYELTVSYSSEASGNPEAYLTPPVIQHTPYEYYEQSDVDANGVPVVNTGDFPFEGGMPLPRQGWTSVVGRWETPASISARNLAFGGRVNAATFVFPDGESVPAKLCLFQGCFKRRKNTNSLHNWVEYLFDSRETGHQYNVADMGALGRFQDPVTLEIISGRFVYGGASGPEPAGPVRLNGNGTPMLSGYKVVPAFPRDATPQPAVANGTSPSIPLINPTLSNANVKILTFCKRKEVSFAGLNL